MTVGVRDGSKISIVETNAYRDMQASAQATQAAAMQQQYAAEQQVLSCHCNRPAVCASLHVCGLPHALGCGFQP